MDLGVGMIHPQDIAPGLQGVDRYFLLNINSIKLRASRISFKTDKLQEL